MNILQERAAMILQGKYSFSLDHKGRLFIPAKFRKMLPPDDDGTLTVTRGFDGSISLYPKHEWRRWKSWLYSLPVNEKKARRLVRWFTGSAEEVSCDRQGRIKIPQHLLDWAGIEDEAIIIGNLDRLEVWSPKLYDADDRDTQESVDRYLESYPAPRREST